MKESCIIDEKQREREREKEDNRIKQRERIINRYEKPNLFRNNFVGTRKGFTQRSVIKIELEVQFE